MSDEAVARASAGLDAEEAQLARLFDRVETRRHALTYLRGLTSGLGRKSIEPIARNLGDGRISALQKFINTGPWRAEEVFRAVQQRFARAAVAPVTGVLVEYGFGKKGNGSVGVERQWNPTTSRRENCQLGCFLVGCTGTTSALLAGSLFLPESWCGPSEAQRRRRSRVRVPAGARYRTRPEIAANLVELTARWGLVDLDWVTLGSPAVGGGFLDEFEALGKNYLIPVRAADVVVPLAPASDRPGRLSAAGSVEETAEAIPAGSWRRAANRLSAGEYATVPVRVPRREDLSRPLWLHARRLIDLGDVRLEYYLSNAGPDVPREELAAALAAPRQALQSLEEAERFLGLGHYETRSWIGWYHHMCLVALAHWLVRSAIAPAARAAGGGKVTRAVRDGTGGD